MLGIRTAWREDCKCLPAWLVYGAILHLPGEFFEEPRTSVLEPGYLHDLQTAMRNMRQPEPQCHGKHPTYCPSNLGSTGWVYVHCDNHRGPLQRPYRGPFQVIEKGDKYYKVCVNGKTENITVDCLKTAYTEQDNQG